MAETDKDQVNVARMHGPIMRDHDEPRDGFEPIPIWWVTVMLAVMMGGGFYLAKYAGDFDGRVYEGGLARPLLADAKAPVPVDLRVLGKRVFNNCMGCHQADGRGLAGQFPPLDGSEWVVGDPDTLVRILLHGLGDQITVAGERYNGVMPAWGRLDDQSLAGVMTYIRNAWGNRADEITGEQVAHNRELSAGRTQPWSATELQQATKNQS